MGVMSEMFGMGRSGDDDMNFHDLDGEGITAELLKHLQVKCHVELCRCGQVMLKHAEGCL